MNQFIKACKAALVAAGSLAIVACSGMNSQKPVLANGEYKLMSQKDTLALGLYTETNNDAKDKGNGLVSWHGDEGNTLNHGLNNRISDHEKVNLAITGSYTLSIYDKSIEIKNESTLDPEFVDISLIKTYDAFLNLDNHALFGLNTKLNRSIQDDTLFFQSPDDIKSKKLDEDVKELKQLQLRVIPVRSNVVLVNLIEFTAKTDSKETSSKDLLVAYYQKIPENESLQIKSSMKNLKAQKKELLKIAEEKSKEQEVTDSEKKEVSTDAPNCEVEPVDQEKTEANEIENKECTKEQNI